MRLALLLLPLLIGCSKKAPDPAKLKKMDWKLAIDDRGRMLPEIELFDQHHTPIVVAPGSYTLTVSRPDNTVLCSVTRTLAKEDYDKTRLKTDWQDATCPPDPAADELRVTLEVSAGDGSAATKLTRDKTTPTKFIYRHLAAKPTAAGSGSGDAKMVTPEAPAGSGSSDAKTEAPAMGSGSGDATKKTVTPDAPAAGSGSGDATKPVTPEAPAAGSGSAGSGSAG